MPPPTERAKLEITRERAVLAAVRLPNSRFDPDDPFGELSALVKQAGAEPVATIDQRLDRPIAGTYMGKGKLEELKALCEQVEASVVVFDHELAPKQIAKIEQTVERKILDRSEVILDIFAGRATTAQARLQVEIAQLEYTYPRLRAMWSHLERISGGSPVGIGTRGPGEQQLEVDRRIVQRRKSMLAARLREIQDRKSREVEKRKESRFSVGLVGYTNAGKSTLFNTLTEGGAYADDRLFATLMTRTRRWDFDGGEHAMLSDTVGFVRDLPHNLVASFRATLEEATLADALLIVLDVSDPAAELHFDTVTRTLDELSREHPDAPEPRRLLLLNKVDKLADNRELLAWQSRVPDSIAIQARPMQNPDEIPPGHAELKARIIEMLAGAPVEVTLRVPLRDTKTTHDIERRAEVIDREYSSEHAILQVQIGERYLARLLDERLATATDASGEPIVNAERPSWKPGG